MAVLKYRIQMFISSRIALLKEAKSLQIPFINRLQSPNNLKSNGSILSNQLLFQYGLGIAT